MSTAKGVPFEHCLVPSYDTPLSLEPSGYLVPGGVAVGFDPAFKNGAPVYMIDGKIVAMDAEYHERTYQDYLAWLFDESHIVRGYD